MNKDEGAADGRSGGAANPGPGLLIWIVALQLEAAPLVARHRMKRLMDESRWPVYQRGNQILIVSGSGKIRAAMAVAWILSHYRDQPVAGLIHFGLCGSNDPELVIGDLILAEQVIDYDSERRYYPDLYLDRPLARRTLECHPRPVQAEKIQEGRIVCCDMESAGIMEAAARLLATHQVLLVKLVSDRLQPMRLDKAVLQQQIERQLSLLDSLQSDLLELADQAADRLTAEVTTLVHIAADQLKLSTSMQRQLYSSIRRAGLLGLDLETIRSWLAEYPVKEKKEGKAALARLTARIDHACLSSDLH